MKAGGKEDNKKKEKRKMDNVGGILRSQQRDTKRRLKERA